MKLRQSERKQAKIRVALQGVSGSGKTFSAILLGAALAEDFKKVAIIDTENHSADLYSHLGKFNVLPLSEPYSPERYIEAIKSCEEEGMEAIIVDSISHEWEGKGGILDQHGGMAGNSFANWNKLTPRHNAFVHTMLQSSAHIIATIRSKTDYVLTEKNGKLVPEKVGLKGITREGLDYEFTVVFDIDLKHHAKATKDRTNLFMGKPDGIITLDTGEKIKEWCNTGTTIEQVKEQINKSFNLSDLAMLFHKYPEFQKELEITFQRRKAKIKNEQSISLEQELKDNGNPDN